MHKAIDEASNDFTSPFAGIVSGSSSEWAIHGVKLLLALLVYGFGLGYLRASIRVRRARRVELGPGVAADAWLPPPSSL